MALSPQPLLLSKRARFLEALFVGLDDERIRYCVLHGHNGLYDSCSGDVDLAVHPDDFEKLSRLFHILVLKGFRPVQEIEYAVQGHMFVFACVDDPAVETIAIDIATEHRRLGRRLGNAKELVVGSVPRNGFHASAPDVEFRYLLAKKAAKGSIRRHQADRLRTLHGEIGPQRTRRMIVDLFGARLAPTVEDAIERGRLGYLLPVLRRRLWTRAIFRYPFQFIQCVVEEFLRVARRICRPTGLWIAVHGPDGAGKSTVIKALGLRLQGLFRRHRAFHWRPMVVWNRKSIGMVTDPHGLPPRNRIISFVRVCVYAADYLVGSVLTVWPTLVRSGLVTFDRYVDDMEIDPKRFRLPESLRLVSRLRPFVPKPQLSVVLDAPVPVLRERKQEVSVNETTRQRAMFLMLAKTQKQTLVCDASQAPNQVAEQAARMVIEEMDRRFQRRLPKWTLPDVRGCWPSLAGDGNSERTHLDSVLGVFNGSRPSRSSAASRKSGSRQGPGVGPRAIFGVRHSFVALPDLQRPRWLIPLGDTVLTRSAFEYRRSYSLKAALVQRVLGGLDRPKFVELLGSTVSVPAQRLDGLRVLIGDVTGVDPRGFSFFFEGGGVRGKVGVLVFDGARQPRFFVKAALTPANEERIRREAETLRWLRKIPALRAHVPRLRFAGSWNGTTVLVQDAVGEKMGGSVLGPPHEAFEQALASWCQTSRPAEQVVKGVSHMLDASCPANAGIPWLLDARKALERVGNEFGAATVRCGVSHGDFAPWNTRISGQVLKVFDWECAGLDVPLGWDRFHFETQVRAHLWYRRLRSRRPRESKSPLFALYLVASLCRGVREGMNDYEIRYRRSLLSRYAV